MSIKTIHVFYVYDAHTKYVNASVYYSHCVRVVDADSKRFAVGEAFV